MSETEQPDEARSPAPPPEEVVQLDARRLRGVAHPLRLRLLAMLRVDGPSTATRLAERLGLASGATSYHLRQLATYGFIEEDTERGTTRERWWRTAHMWTNFDAAAVAPEAPELTDEFLRAVAALYTDQMLRAVDEWGSLPTEWQRAATFSDLPLLLNPAEAGALLDEVFAVIRRYRLDTPEQRADAPADAAPVTIQLQTFRRPGWTPETESEL